MNVINFQDASCAHCYKCLRHCPVKAIRVKGGRAQIMQDLCVYCGHWMEVCPQNAKTFESDLAYVKSMLYRKEQIIVSLDPSYKGLLHYEKTGQIVAALLKLGFSQVRETAEGAALVTQEYRRLVEEGTMENIITSTCPGVNALVEKYYPELIPYLAPIISPMLAHGKMIREVMGPDVKIVFIGPCVAKKMEAELDPRTRGVIDAVIEFNELEQWLEEEGIDLMECEEAAFANPDPQVNQLYAVNCGIIRSVKAAGGLGKYLDISVNGLGNCREMLHSMKRGYIKNCFIELDCCDGVCVNGPGVDKRRGYRFKARMDIENSALHLMPEIPFPLPKEKMVRTYRCKRVEEQLPTEEEIQEILKTIGKSNSTKEFNCGACGYSTCRDKAIAIYQGKAEPSMCLLRTFEVTRSKANVVLDTTPHAILIFDRELRITEYNRKAAEIFKTPRGKALQMYLFDFIDPTEFESVFKTGENVLHKKVQWPMYHMTVVLTVVYIDNIDSCLAIIEDATAEEKRAEHILRRKLKTVEVAQSVIDKQMQTAQEIAGLLGETTAETKAILTQLRDSILEDEV